MTTLFSVLRVTAAACLLIAVGCDAGGEPADPSGRAPFEQVKGDATVRGKVIFGATPPKMRELTNEPCHPGAPRTILEETVVVGGDGGLKNVIVAVEGVRLVDGATLPPVLLDQVDCRYVPHVVALCVGQTLKVRNSDPTFHNTHYTPGANPANNFGLTTKGLEKDVRFISAEIFPVRCDVHPWMSGYIGVFDHPFVAVTDDSGRFEIKNLPAGGYTLVAWHEVYGRLRQPIQVSSDGVVESNFEYKPPGK